MSRTLSNACLLTKTYRKYRSRRTEIIYAAGAEVSTYQMLWRRAFCRPRDTAKIVNGKVRYGAQTCEL